MSRTGQASVNFTGPLSGLGNAFLRMGGLNSRTKLESPDGGKVKQPPQSLKLKLWLGARFPYIAFCMIACLFTYTYHMFPMLPWLLVFLCLNFAVLMAWPAKDIGIKRRTIWDWAPMVSWMVAIGYATTFGLINYGIIEGWVNTTFLREYDNIRFDTDPRAVIDGGVLNFAEGTSLDTSRSAGYKLWLDEYCAAPIVKSDKPEEAPVGFWAVGMGCCKSRGEFACDDAKDASAHSGVRLSPHSLGPQTAEGYKKAIHMAAAASGLEVAKETVFVMWAKNPHSVGKAAWWIATGVFFGVCSLATCACCVCQAGLTHISEMEQ